MKNLKFGKGSINYKFYGLKKIGNSWIYIHPRHNKNVTLFQGTNDHKRPWWGTERNGNEHNGGAWILRNKACTHFAAEHNLFIYFIMEIN